MKFHQQSVRFAGPRPRLRPPVRYFFPLTAIGAAIRRSAVLSTAAAELESGGETFSRKQSPNVERGERRGKRVDSELERCESVEL